jgi:hypothetical protein
MSHTHQDDNPPTQAFGFQQLRQACEISTLRQDLAMILGDASALHHLIEKNVERVRQRLATLEATDRQDVEALSSLVSAALTALHDIRDASRRFNAAIAGHDAPPPCSVGSLRLPPGDAAPAPEPDPRSYLQASPEAPLPESPSPAEPPPLAKAASTVPPAFPRSHSATTINWLMPARPPALGDTADQA